MSTAAKWSFGVFMALGLFLLSFGAYFIYEAVASTSWNQVEEKLPIPELPCVPHVRAIQPIIGINMMLL